MYRILLVEDDEALRYVYARMHAWQENGFCLAAQAANGKQALEQLDKERFDLIVTDIRMPFIDGLELLRELRRRAIQTPVILVSSYGEFEYAREGLVLGAFDYIVKPFSPKELMARINVVLDRRNSSSHNKSDVLKFGGLEINIAARTVTVDGKRVDLTPKEYELLFYLIENRNIALSRDKLLSDIWGYDFFGDDRTIDTHIKNLRNNLGPYRDYIVTLRGVGYKFEFEE